MSSILSLLERAAILPEPLQAAWQAMFSCRQSRGQIHMPTSMHAWAERQFGALDVVATQDIVRITNHYTQESAIFNPARARRPAMSRSDDTQIEAWIERELQNDIFANPEQTTPEDVFGRVRGQYCVTASNIAKYDGWHGVVICNEPHPLRFNREQVRDYLATAWRWIEAAHACDPAATHPIITWNCMPHSGASLAHGHLQVALSHGEPYARVQAWRLASQRYHAEHQRTYLADLAALHKALGLLLPPVADVTRLAHLLPARNHEVVLLGNGGQLEALADALYETLRMLFEQHGTRSFNAALAFPPLGQPATGELPVFGRVGDRGNPLAVRSDVGVMELYGTPVITADPYALV